MESSLRPYVTGHMSYVVCEAYCWKGGDTTTESVTQRFFNYPFTLTSCKVLELYLIS